MAENKHIYWRLLSSFELDKKAVFVKNFPFKNSPSIRLETYSVDCRNEGQE